MQQRKQRGAAVLFSLGIVVLLSTLGSAVLLRSLNETQLSRRSSARQGAFFLAEGGVDQALLNLRTPTDLTDDVNTSALLTGTFTIDSPPVDLGNDRWQVTTHGTAQQEQRTMQAVFQLTPQSVFQFALFGSQGVTISGNATTNNYDSRLGSYASQTPGHNGDVGTNSTAVGGVTISGSIFVDGQVAVGQNVSNPTSVVTGYNPAFITGGTSPPTDTQDVVSQTTPFPMPTNPTNPPGGCNTNLPPLVGKTRTFLTGTNYCPPGIQTINGGETWTANGMVKIYISDELKINGNSTVGVASDPTLMRILMSTGSAATMEGTITGSTDVYAAIYGPQATINISGNAKVFGAVIAKQVNVSGSAEIHYDEATASITDISNLYVTSVTSWREL